MTIQCNAYNSIQYNTISTIPAIQYLQYNTIPIIQYNAMPTNAMPMQ